MAANLRQALVASAGCELLLNEYVALLMRNSEDGKGDQDMFQKLEQTGFDIGRRYVERLTRDRERFVEVLDVIKFVCREFWSEVFKKAVDKLQTNNRGVYVLQDFNFRWTRFMSAPVGEDTKAHVLKYLILPCGMLRGALAAFGFDCVVNADIGGLPRAVFHIRIKTPGAPAAAAAAPAAT